MFAADVAALGSCAGRPCWRSTKRGYRYKDSVGVAGGVRRLRLGAGGDGSARLYARAGAENLVVPVGPLPAPVLVQLALDDGQSQRCWQSTFSDFLRNDGRVLVARSP